MKNKIISKQIEIFCGTGGVGKTTLATSRALHLALRGKKVLIMTIDPAKRLKQIIGLSDKDLGKIKTINTDLFFDIKKSKVTTFDALLMAPIETLKIINNFHGISNNFQNPIISILMRPHGGLNEIMSIVELHQQFESGKYDSIILDTPPGHNFIDFLEAGNKINAFFEKSLMDVFNIISDKKNSKSYNILSNVISSGINKLLSYLELVTGKIFVENFVDSVVSIYKLKNSFLTALAVQDYFKSPEYCNWFLVTSIEQQKFSQAQILKNRSEKFINNNAYLLINKSLTPFLEKWILQPTDDEKLIQLKNAIGGREKKFKNIKSQDFNETLFFPEILEESPQKHVRELTKGWEF